MTIYDYCAHKNPYGSAKVVASFGMRPIKDVDELAKQLAFCAKRNGGEVLRRIVLIHPDRALFEHERKLNEAKKLSAAGIEQVPHGLPEKSDTDIEKEKLAQQERERLMQKSESESKLLSQNNLIIGGVIVLGLALIMKK